MLSQFTLASILLFALATLSNGRPLNTTINTIQPVSDRDIDSSNWAGAVLQPSVTVRSATAIIHVPFIWGAAGSTATAWVGIGSDIESVDGSACPTGCSALFRAGITMYIHDDGTDNYYAWYQLFPEGLYIVSRVPVSPGDQIEFTLDALFPQVACVTMVNLTQRERAIRCHISIHRLERTSAQWIVDRRDTHSGGMAPFPYFGHITFTQLSVSSTARSYPADGSTVYTITQDGRPLTSVTLMSTFLGIVREY